MAGNDNERTLVPAEIDVLEDALEQAPSSVLSLPSTLDDDARTRIHDVLVRYRAIERHAQALLRVEPPAAVLAAVMAEARAAAVPSAAPSPAPSETPSLWSRIKALWIVPSLAAVGATALVLVMVTQTKTSDDARSSSPAPTTVAAAERKADAKSEAMPPLAQAEGRANDGVAEQEDQRGAGLVDDVTAIDAAKPSENAEVTTRLEESSRAEKRRSANVDTPSDPAPSVDPFAPKPEPKATPRSTPKAPPKPTKPSSGTGGAPGGVPTPTTPNAGPKSPKSDEDEKAAPTGQERLSRADAARRRGDCNTARPDYDQVVETGTSKQRARARAGIALCLEQAGDTAGARSLIDRARQDDAQIDAWVDAER